MQDRIKYPRTFHMIGSPGICDDDKVIESMDNFFNTEIVITEKLDGENSSLYNDYYHARSIDGRHHPSRDWIKQFHASIKHLIPVGDRICGENLYAKHSIYYDDLESYFYGFSYWCHQMCLDYDNTTSIFETLNIKTPEVLYKGIYDENIIQNIINSFPNEKEGFVIRKTQSFHYTDFKDNVVKWVRPHHVATNIHWMHDQIIPNKIKL